MSDLWRLPAARLAALVRARELRAPKRWRDDALARLAAANPVINAVVECRPEEVLAAARAVDAALARGEDPGPLAGVPVTIKSDRRPGGLRHHQRLRQPPRRRGDGGQPAGGAAEGGGGPAAGRTNTPAFSLRWFTRNRLYGATPQPPRPRPHPRRLFRRGGGGAGRRHRCHRPRHRHRRLHPLPGLCLRRARAAPNPGAGASVEPSQPDRLMDAALTAVAGPLARSVEDLALALAVLARPDGRDPLAPPVPLADAAFRLPQRAALAVRPEGLDTVPEVEAALRATAAALQERGWTVVETSAAAAGRRRAAAIRPVGGRDAAGRGSDPRRGRSGCAGMVRLRYPPGGRGRICPPIRTPSPPAPHLMRQWDRFLQHYPLVILPPSAALPFPDHADVAGRGVSPHRRSTDAADRPARARPAGAGAGHRPGGGRTGGRAACCPALARTWLLAVGQAIEAEGIAAPAGSAPALARPD